VAGDWPAAAQVLWRARFTLAGAPVPESLGALEEAALSVSLFAIEEEASAEAVAWQVSAFFAQAPEKGALRRELAAILGREVGDLEIDEVPAQDWVAASAMHQEPVRVGRFFVHAPKDRALLPPDAVPIEVEAGLAFGSGEHATTQACLEAIDRLAAVRRCRTVLDLGCGSAILAMGAARAWPTARVIAADNDPVAVRIARENVAKNGLAARVAVALSDGFRNDLIRRAAPFDLILANILADPLIELAPALARRLAPGGFAVLSGLLDRQAEAVTRAYVGQGLRPHARLGTAPWVGLVLRKPQRLARRRAAG
jgi:ribosomal protein L11 methyltransferase